MDKSKRDKQTQELRGSHFHFGFDKLKNSHSVSKETFQLPKGEGKAKLDEQKKEIKELSQKIRKSNFEIGDKRG